MDPVSPNPKNSRTFILHFALAASLALNPDFLALAGRIWGNAGFAGGLALVLAAGFYLLVGCRLKQAALFQGREKHSFIRLAGIGVRILTLVFLATGILVSSGFAFNEIFVYWFPNFGFAFLLLGILCMLQLFNRKMVYQAQIIFFSITAAGLILITAAGLIRPNTVTVPLFQAVPPGEAMTRPGTLFLAFVLFVGFDLGFGTGDKTTPEPGRATGSAVIFTAFILVVWGMVMLSHVPAGKLSETAIPHLIAARKIWGETGRIIMGVTIISGSLAAIHALFTNIFHRVMDLAEKNIIPPKLIRPKTVIVILTVIIGSTMGMGLAGSDSLEILIRCSLILWFLYHAAVWFFLTPHKS